MENKEAAKTFVKRIVGSSGTDEVFIDEVVTEYLPAYKVRITVWATVRGK